MNFADRLDAATERVRTPALVGIDPHLDLLPDEYAAARDPRVPLAERAELVERFCFELLDVVAGRVAAVKPQSAFFELLGSDGVRAFENVCARARSLDLLVIGDVKRGDIASTASAYAESFLASGEHRCDAVTVSPYLGPDTLEPFANVCAREDGGMYVLLRTSNPGGGAFQLHGTPALWEEVAGALERLGTDLIGNSGFSSIGAVVGATHAAELATIRARLPKTPFLLPGYGAQGAGADDVKPAFCDAESPWRGGLVNSSRGIAFAWRKDSASHPKDAASKALDRMIADLAAALDIR
ncbi:MAG TPA: orotidine-5'-phosphate decarboxylase [Planctomycetes bacterium]|nr:orotidine-5'-phosphate decarboxylase [Planctomycetota bacterium]